MGVCARGPRGAVPPTPEGLIWLLLTSEVPTKEQEQSLTKELHARGAIPEGVERLIRSLPRTLHPMSHPGPRAAGGLPPPASKEMGAVAQVDLCFHPALTLSGLMGGG